MGIVGNGVTDVSLVGTWGVVVTVSSDARVLVDRLLLLLVDRLLLLLVDRLLLLLVDRLLLDRAPGLGFSRASIASNNSCLASTLPSDLC